MKKYTHLTDLERNSIAYYLNQGFSYSKIGRLLGRSDSTIGWEVKRNSKEDGQYEPAYAQAASEERFSSIKTCEKLTPEVKEQINQSLSLNWSPWVLVMFIGNRNGISLVFCSIYMLKNEVVCSLTADNGKEFSNYEELEEKLQVHVYFAVPYCSW